MKARSSSLLAATALVGLLSTRNNAVLAQFPSNDTACTGSYTVIAGDTCDMIGQKTLTPTYQIMSINLPHAGSTCHTLQIGASICLGKFGNDCQLVHRVTSSDTCASIAAQYGISVQLLQDNNPLAACDAIYDGLVLCVAPGLIRPPADPSLNATAIKAGLAGSSADVLQRAQELNSVLAVAASSAAGGNADSKQQQQGSNKPAAVAAAAGAPKGATAGSSSTTAQNAHQHGKPGSKSHHHHIAQHHQAHKV